MTILEVIQEPDKRLHQISLPVLSVGKEERQLFDNMLETMYSEDGVGLAAIQVGILKRMVVIDFTSEKDEDLKKYNHLFPIFMANPQYIYKSVETDIKTEACLSLPSIKVEIERNLEVEISYLDYNNNHQTLRVDGWFARAIQHELDHLDGKLLIDYLSKFKRSVAIEKLQKRKKNKLK